MKQGMMIALAVRMIYQVMKLLQVVNTTAKLNIFALVMLIAGAIAFFYLYYSKAQW